MAVSPILLNTLPFDAEKEHVLEFTYSGSQIFAHKITVKDNSTNTVVYEQKTSAMTTTITIPANTLTNGTTYNFTVIVYDRDDVASPASNSIVLKCLKTPTFYIDGVQEGAVIRNSGLDATIVYEQENSELLNAYRIVLYAVNQTTVVFDSGLKYSSSGLTTRITALVDDSTYYIRATGETVNGMEMDTGLIQISCDYLKPDIFLMFRADNIAEEGLIRLSSNFISVEGSSDPAELTYINNEKVSLVNGEKVYFDQGFNANNFVLQLVTENCQINKTMLLLDMQNVMVELKWHCGYFEGYEEQRCYAVLTAWQYIGTEKLEYIQFSNHIPIPSETDQIHFWIKHKDGLFDVIIENTGTPTTTEEGDVE